MTAGATDAFGFLSRRRLLKLGVGAAAVLAGGGAGLLALRGEAPPVEGLRALDAQQFRTLTHLARAHLPPGGVIPDGADEAGLARAFDGWLADEPAENLSDLRTALGLVELGPPLFDLRMTTFSNLPPEAQAEHWQGWLTSDLALRRQVGIAFRKFFSLVYFDRPSVWAHIGYPGPSMGGDR